MVGIAVAVSGAAIGAVSARSIVAEADAHRWDRPDRWWGPECDRCDCELDWTLLRCTDGHRHRTANVVIAVVTAALFAGIPFAIPSPWLIPAYWWFAYFAVLLTVTDIDTKLIPNRILLPGTVGGVILLVAGGVIARDFEALLRAGVGGAAYLAVMLLLALIARGALGLGDVKLSFLLGVFTAYLGWGHLLVAGIGSFVLGGVISILLLVTRRASRKDFIPFGPFMTSAAILAVLFGDAIVTWYAG